MKRGRRRFVDAAVLLRTSDGTCPRGIWVRVSRDLYRYGGLKVERTLSGWLAKDVLQGKLRRFETRAFRTRSEAFDYAEACEEAGR